MTFINELNPLLVVFLCVCFNWFTTLIGSLLVLFVKGENKKLVCMALGVAAGIMIAASFFSLLLPAKEQLESMSKIHLTILPLGFLCGAGFLRLCDKFLPHEHLMSQDVEGLPSSFSKSKLLMLAMTLHNIPEGLAVGVAFAGCINGNLLPAFILSIGIGIQNFPEGTAISLPMHQSGKTKFQAIMYGQFSGIVEIPSALIGYFFATLINGILPFALSFAAGAMMFVCIEDLIPEANSTSDIDIGTMSCIAGFLIMMALDVLLS